MMKILAVILIAITISYLPATAIAKKTILVIESYHSEFAWDQSYISGLQSIFKEDFRLLYFQMNTKRLPVNLHQQQADHAWQYFQQSQADLVVLGDDNALKYLGPRFTETDVPVVFFRHQ